jgi:hypothetical protein
MTTKQQKLADAIQAARRFVELGEQLLNAWETGAASTLTGCRESGAAKRASMDLTRSLADSSLDGLHDRSLRSDCVAATSGAIG